MKSTLEMIRSHPHEPICESEKLAAVIAAIKICAQACTSCADACLGEKKVESLVGCIRHNLDCADICNATAAVISRMTKPSREVLQSIVQSCATACNLCATECEKHAEMHEHCRICGAACRSCEKECLNIMELIR